MLECCGDAAVEVLAKWIPTVHARLHSIDPTLDSSSTLSAGLSAMQFQVLEIVASSQPLTNGRLSELLGRAQSSVSELTERLEQRGLLCRSPGQDRRKAMLSLTTEGAQALEWARSQQKSSLASLLSALDAPSRNALMHHLSEFIRITDLPSGNSRAALN